MELDGAVAVVTGGGTGIGAAVAEALARAGAGTVVVTWSRSGDAAAATAERLRELGCDAEAVRLDVRDDAAVREVLGGVAGRHGRTDVLVNNAGTTRWVPFEDLDALTPDVWDEVLGVNLLGAFSCARALAPALRRSRGAVVDVASVSAARAIGSSIPYGVSKAALVQLTRALARALAPEVRVNAVSPGTVETRWQVDHHGAEGFADLAEHERRVSPLQRTAQPEHVAQVVLGLLAADMVTGQEVVVDGGRGLGY